MNFLSRLPLAVEKFDERVDVSEVRQRKPYKDTTDSLGVVVSASSAIAVDAQSGEILFLKNSDAVVSIASITKLMTALVLVDSVSDWSRRVTMSKDDETSMSSKKIYRGDEVTMNDLFIASLAGSDNDSTKALVRATGMSETEFVAAMNAKAQSLHMQHTTFYDPTGLDSGNVSTVYDLVYLIKAALSLQKIRNITTSSVHELTTVKGNVRRIDNTDKLLESFVNQYPYKIIGGKTGYLPDAGYCFSAWIRNETKKAEIITIALNSQSMDSRFQDVKAMSVWIFENFTWK
ncbi:MAG: D-alanyl-D-alanine carboxypeptidase [Parcubacteria group bacterium]|nr:D-alanyl-D-alanine carboxypeptidase [Parcubacteria group bacterium]